MAGHKFLVQNDSTRAQLSKWGDGKIYFHIMKFQNTERKENIQKPSKVGLGEGSRQHSGWITKENGVSLLRTAVEIEVIEALWSKIEGGE